MSEEQNELNEKTEQSEQPKQENSGNNEQNENNNGQEEQFREPPKSSPNGAYYAGYQNGETGYGYGQTPPPPPPKKKPNKTALAFVFLAAAYVLLAAVVALYFLRSDTFKSTDERPTADETQTEPGDKNPPIGFVTGEDGNPTIKRDDYTGEALKTKEIYKNTVDSVVYIESSIGAGSGFVIDEENGYIITNCHVIENAKNISVEFYNGDVIKDSKVTVVGEDSVNDVAVLKVDYDNLKKVTTGDSSKTEVGDDIILVGHPLGDLKWSLTKGVISAHDRDVNTGNYTIKMFQIDAAANAGNSGGPALDATGAVVGILSAKYVDTAVEGIVFCIPINDALKIAQELVAYGYVKGRPNFGISVRGNYYGAIVDEVYSGSCAEKAGIKPGDIITKLGDTPITSGSQLLNVKNLYKAGDTVTVEIYRNGRYMQVEVTFDEYVPNDK